MGDRVEDNLEFGGTGSPKFTIWVLRVVYSWELQLGGTWNSMARGSKNSVGGQNFFHSAPTLADFQTEQPEVAMLTHDTTVFILQ